MLSEPHIYRKRGEKVEEALYRDSQQRAVRQKLIKESKSQKEEQERIVKVTLKSQQMAVNKFERDLEALVKQNSTAEEVENQTRWGYKREEPEKRTVTRDQLLMIFRVTEVFRELEPGEKTLMKSQAQAPMSTRNTKSRSVSPIQPQQTSFVSHKRVDSFRKTQRLKQELAFFNCLWDTLLSPPDQTNFCDYEICVQTLKILFNHYFPNPRQCQLLSDLQRLVNQFSPKPALTLSLQQIDDQLVIPFQSLYPHYYDINNITKLVQTEKKLTTIQEHFKEATFHPKIDRLSANIDMQNISQMYAKISQQSAGAGQRPDLILKQAKQRESDGQDVSDFSDDDRKSRSNIRSQQVDKSHGSLNLLKKQQFIAKERAHSRQNSDIGQKNSTGSGHLEVNRRPMKSFSRAQELSPRPKSQKSDIGGAQVNKSVSGKSPSTRFDYLHQTQLTTLSKIKELQDVKAKEEVQGCTFKPKINHLSNIPRVTVENKRNLPEHISPAKRFEQLYKVDVQKRQAQQKQFEEIKLKKEEEKAKVCTFQPKTLAKSRSPIDTSRLSSSKTPPRITGYEDTVNRLRMAQLEKQRQKEAFENLGRVKNLDHSQKRGSTTQQQPFQLSYMDKDRAYNTAINSVKNSAQKAQQDVSNLQPQQAILHMEILVKQGQKVKLKIMRDDDPDEVANNFARIYGINRRSQEALAKIIRDQLIQSGHVREKVPQPEVNQEVEEPQSSDEEEKAPTNRDLDSSYAMSTKYQQVQYNQQAPQLQAAFSTDTARFGEQQPFQEIQYHAPFPVTDQKQPWQKSDNSDEKDDESREETDVIEDDDDNEMEVKSDQGSAQSDNFPSRMINQQKK
ncbi:hypothetical protein FGO68_gene2960 [Halteria grandinella]|uniref:Uncharacterized protein n=1 Tax=Halteria grandinella TaxID=5974 RepID=A0A8J8NFA6_HALGN|nr:hypothetical protein FGO68_gene2960 [Halteria grandinella]